MPPWPSLTESWAAVYFEVTAAILIFGVGLPSLVLQGIVHEDVRRIVYRHRKWLRQGEAGVEKELALNILQQLANQIQTRIAYSGNGLESVVQAIEATLYGGDVKNFLHATKILQKLIIGLQQKNLADAPDMGAILRVLQRVGSMALELESELAALTIQDIVSLVGQRTDGAFQLSGSILFELGVKALEKKGFLFAVAVLNRLETMIMRESPPEPEKAVNYLGLLAHFWHAGATVKERARLSLKKLHCQAGICECL